MTVTELIDDIKRYPGHGTILIWDKAAKDYRPCERWELAVVSRLMEERE